MAKYNVENENVEIEIERLFKVDPELAYQAWVDKDFLIHWFMTTERTNQTLTVNAEPEGRYEIIDERKGKRNYVKGSYIALEPNGWIEMTVGMPELSDSEDHITVEFLEREPGKTHMIFTYTAYVPKERRLTTLEYKQLKKEYHDSTAHGFELMFDRLHELLADYESND
ncbi:SRPBCC domain-containing protein [Staphylococcus sp. SQ8-PEA]|uniref:SRPBCC domain-containing protein n=1 Tax=Staphylococcus marylandisciuri TaxID=2981529 RepID=A0ABT2QML7_9STAP|nr:SRPBCC domain-containing protein [Staphylococcus marylandisciuri]MCU5745228.1 SRPBCC domain-containing protein [Staphylococcus marylandisciuri]